jgi:hypothetical protein
MRSNEREIMFGNNRREEPDEYDEPINKVLKSMETFAPEDAEFEVAIGHLERLTKLRNERYRSRFSPDTVLLVAGNLLGILVIVAYEQKHVIRSTATSFLLKVK